VDNTNVSSTGDVPSEGLLTGMTALERRRFLFKSLGKGAAVGAVLANPIRASAQAADPVLVCKSPTTGQLSMCSVSGMQSAIGSRQLTTSQAVGKSPGYWGKLDGDSCVNIGTTSIPVWGPKMERTCPAFTWTTLVSDVLTLSTVASNVTLAMLMAQGDGKCTNSDGKTVNYGKYRNKPERHWICAIFNAAQYYPLNQFPYDATTIQNVANGVNTSIDKDNLYKLLKSLEG